MAKKTAISDRDNAIRDRSMNPYRPWWLWVEWAPFYGEQLAKDVAVECADESDEVKRVKWAARLACRRLRAKSERTARAWHEAAIESYGRIMRQVVDMQRERDAAVVELEKCKEVLRKLRSAIIDCRAYGAVPNAACLAVIDEVLGDGR